MRFPPFLVALILSSAPAPLAAQQAAASRPLTRPSDYPRWERLLSPTLSPDGEWVVVPINRVDRTAELRVYGLRAGADTTPFVAKEGRDPVFALDSRWLAYAIGHSEAERNRQLRLIDGKLKGQASAQTTDEPVYFALTSYLELGR